MRDRYDKELEQLTADLNDMGAMTLDIVTNVMECLENRDNGKIEEINASLTEISRFERTIENNCMRLIMRQQPIASDLRRIRSAMFMIYDMERIGIQSAEIAEMLDYVVSHPLRSDDVIMRLGSSSVQMVSDSILACRNQNEKEAMDVIYYDDVVDNLFEEAKKSLIGTIQDGGADAESCLDMLMIAKYFERIADHAESLADWVYFSKTGEHISK